MLVKVEEMHDTGGSVVRTTVFPPDAPPLHEIDESNRNAKDITQDYTDLILLISANSVVFVFTALWYRVRKHASNGAVMSRAILTGCL